MRQTLSLLSFLSKRSLTTKSLRLNTRRFTAAAMALKRRVFLHKNPKKEGKCYEENFYSNFSNFYGFTTSNYFC